MAADLTAGTNKFHRSFQESLQERALDFNDVAAPQFDHNDVVFVCFK